MTSVSSNWFAAFALMISVASPIAAKSAQFSSLFPILQTRCVMCHSGPTAAAALRLDSFESLIAGSSKGPVIKAGDPAGSELIRRIKGIAQPRMPMTGPPFLSDDEIARFERWVAAGASAGTPSSTTAPVSAPVRRADAPVDYNDVAPIFARHCTKCHTDNGQMGPAPEGYRLTSHAATLASTDRARVVPGSAPASELLRRIRGQSLPRMPMDGPPWLSDDEIALVARWINEGARDAVGVPAPVPSGARVRLGGRMTDTGLDDLPLATGARRDRSVPVGSAAEVRGTVNQDGSIRPERIRPR